MTGCDKIVWYWKFGSIAHSIYNVKGFDLLYMDTAAKPIPQIAHMAVEFDSIAWGLDDGELGCNTTAKKMR